MKQRVRVADDSDCSCAANGRGILYREGRRHCTVIINFYQLRGRSVCVCARRAIARSRADVADRARLCWRRCIGTSCGTRTVSRDVRSFHSASWLRTRDERKITRKNTEPRPVDAKKTRRSSLTASGRPLAVRAIGAERKRGRITLGRRRFWPFDDDNFVFKSAHKGGRTDGREPRPHGREDYGKWRAGQTGQWCSFFGDDLLPRPRPKTTGTRATLADGRRTTADRRDQRCAGTRSGQHCARICYLWYDDDGGGAEVIVPVRIGRRARSSPHVPINCSPPNDTRP